MTGKTYSIVAATGFINIAPGALENLSYFSLGDKNYAILTTEEIAELTNALYAAQDLEVIPLRDELLAFLQWLDPYFNNSSNPHDIDVDRYLETLEPQTPTDDGEFL